MVAAAPERGTLSPTGGTILLAVYLLFLLFGVPMSERFTILGLSRLPKPPVVLADRAATLLEELGLAGPGVDRAYGFNLHFDYLRHIGENDSRPRRWEALKNHQPTAVRFWYRESPEPLLNWNWLVWRPRQHNPPQVVPGMATVVLDPEGRLVELQVVPPRTEAQDRGDGRGDPDFWVPLFAAARLDPNAFEPTRPKTIPPVYADTRYAWEGVYPERSDVEIRVEAAAFDGIPVLFQILEPWDSADSGSADGSSTMVASVLVRFSIPLLLLSAGAGVWLARQNVRRGRGDRRGAFHLAGFVFVCTVLGWVAGAHHTASLGELWSFMGGLAEASLRACYLWVVYLALEPFVRRRWPQGIVSWNRLLVGRYRDPSVGRDLLIGALCATAALSVQGLYLGLLHTLERPYFLYDDVWLKKLSGLGAAAGEAPGGAPSELGVRRFRRCAGGSCAFGMRVSQERTGRGSRTVSVAGTALAGSGFRTRRS